MIRHLVRLMWNRKRQNLLLTAEIFVAFLVVVAVSVLCVHFGYNALQPVGFAADDVWTLGIGRSGPREPTEAEVVADRDRLIQVIAEARGTAGVEDVTAAFVGPYGWYTWGESVDLEDGRSIDLSTNRADDAFARLLSIEMVAGRWFSREDDGSVWEPVVINSRLARQVFGDVDPVGLEIPQRPSSGRGVMPQGAGDRRKRVVGVIEDFRQFGELSMPGAVMFYRLALDVPVDRSHHPEVLLLKVAPGTTAALEEHLVGRLRQVAPEWSFTVQPVAAQREAMLRDNLVPLAIVCVVAGAMLLMVALGLTGIVWQSVTQRIREFGLRRAQGATASAIRRQVVGELLVMTSFALAAGCLLLLQIPLLPLPPQIAVVPRAVFTTGVLLAMAGVYGVTLLCAWYPSRLATRVPPAEALHYE